MRHVSFSSLRRSKWLKASLIVLAVCLMVGHLIPSSAAKLLDRRLFLTTADINATAEYKLLFSLTSPITYGSVQIRICSNDPNPLVSCVTPPGLDMTGAVLSDQTGPSGFTIRPGATTNRLILTRTPAAAPPGAISYTLQNIKNPSTPGTYYVRILTFPTDDATGPYSDEGGIAYAITNSLSITATVPPYLTFCTGLKIPNLNCTSATGDYINFGELSSSRTASGTSQMLAATNAQSGYNISVAGTTMTSGSHVITPLTGDVSRPGTAQFGLNLVGNSAPAAGASVSGPGSAGPTAPYRIPNVYRFNDSDTVVSYPVPDNLRLYTASYIVNVPKTQAPGIYVTTLTYVCLGTF